MNEKIKKLAEQARAWVNDTNNVAPDIEYVFYKDAYDKKFAELIVRECLAQVDKVDTMLDDDKEKTGVAWVGLAIAKHFGVEE